ncbi:MAG: hypothetical protein KAI50_08945 [Desulfobacterales bacterium]|nr:hypothetical protein [Desulfobacterales bacterium]
MAKVYFFLLLPETKPTNQWMRSTEVDFSKIESYETLIRDLKKISESIAIESYEGCYDLLNINNFLCLYDTLEDCYPSAPKKLLQRVIYRNAFVNWREEEMQSPDTDYYIFNQPISDNTFCEMAERKNMVGDDKYALLNHSACTIQNMITVSINRISAIEIDNLKNEEELLAWFAQYRLPPRSFNINPKHGENRQDVREVGGKKISPLRCSRQKAQALLDTAIGNPEKELYNLDPDYDEIIVFKYESPTPQNMYHGYHVPKDSTEVPIDFRRRLNRP